MATINLWRKSRTRKKHQLIFKQRYSIEFCLLVAASVLSSLSRSLSALPLSRWVLCSVLDPCACSTSWSQSLELFPVHFGLGLGLFECWIALVRSLDRHLIVADQLGHRLITQNLHFLQLYLKTHRFGCRVRSSWIRWLPQCSLSRQLPPRLQLHCRCMKNSRYFSFHCHERSDFVSWISLLLSFVMVEIETRPFRFSLFLLFSGWCVMFSLYYFQCLIWVNHTDLVCLH